MFQGTTHIPTCWRHKTECLIKNCIKKFLNLFFVKTLKVVCFLCCRKVCSLFVLIDNSFLNLLHKNTIQSALNQVLRTIDEANTIFRSTDFDEDGEPDNIGFYIKYMVIVESEKSPLNLVPHFSQQPIDGMVIFT